jgi:hypothetical protein
MKHQWHRMALFGLLALGPVGIVAGQAPPPVPDKAEQVKWNLKRLHEAPFKLIKATPDEAGQVRFLVEFTRKPELAELFDWEHRGGPVVFRFLDADGIVMRTVKPRLDGELISEKGARIRLILQLPDPRTLELTHGITAD